MKTIIAGSRSISNPTLIQAAITASSFHITEVVSGCARGVDVLGEQWAQKHNIPIKYFPADWNTFGKSAGYRRNEQMAQYAQTLIAIWDGTSKGTQHMINLANKYNLLVYVHET